MHKRVLERVVCHYVRPVNYTSTIQESSNLSYIYNNKRILAKSRTRQTQFRHTTPNASTLGVCCIYTITTANLAIRDNDQNP